MRKDNRIIRLSRFFAQNRSVTSSKCALGAADLEINRFISQFREYLYFSEPVDLASVPDYLDKVTTPMDLAQIKVSLSSSSSATPLEERIL